MVGELGCWIRTEARAEALELAACLADTHAKDCGDEMCEYIRALKESS